MEPTNNFTNDIIFKDSKNKNPILEPDLRIAVLKKNHALKIIKEKEFKQNRENLSFSQTIVVTNPTNNSNDSNIGSRLQSYFSCFFR